MANGLKMVQVHTIEGLWKQGWSRRRIAQELGINRETVGKYVAQLSGGSQNQPHVTPGKLADLSPFTALSASPDPPKPATQVTPGSEGDSRSKCIAYRAVILEKLELRLSARRIFQDLVRDHGFLGGYQSVKRYVRKLGALQGDDVQAVRSALRQILG